MKTEAMVLALLILTMNGSLWVAGLNYSWGLGADEMPNVYKHLPLGLQDLNASNTFQENLILVDDQNRSVAEATQKSFITTSATFLLDLIKELPILGGVFTLFLVAFEIILTATFGVTLVALKINLPIEWVIFLGIINFGIVSFGAFELAKEFIGARGTQ